MNTHSLSIFLIEDDVVDRKAFLRAMKALKIINPVIMAEDGVEALTILRGKHPELSIERPFIIVLDLNMPRMSGLQFLERIRDDEDLRDVVVLILTTSKAQRDIEQAYAHHVAGYLLKDDLGASFMRAIDALNQYWRLVELPAD